MSGQTNIRRYNFIQPVIIGFAAAIGLITGYKMDIEKNDFSLIEKIGTESEGFRTGKIEEILRFVESNYVDEVDQNTLIEDAISNVLGSLDPHSDYIPPEYLDLHNERMEGEYAGLGVEMINIDDVFYISRTTNDSPAQKAGLKAGNAIIEINGQLVSGNGTSFDEVRELIREEEGNEVSLVVRDLVAREDKTIQTVVARIPIPSASSAYLVNGSTGYIRIDRFSSNTYTQFMTSVERLLGDREALNLIIDLRNNPGGYLPQAIKILCQIFREKDRLLTYTEGKHRKRAEYFSTGKRFFNIDKVAVLLNEYSASGSEVIAGAIQDWDRGLIIGTPSYGKGLVQEIYNLRNGGALRLTVAKYYTPSGRLIQKPYTTINGDTNTDSTAFLTKVLARNMPGAGGIIPDFVVEDHTATDCIGMLDYIDEFLMHEFVLNRKFMDVQSDAIVLKFKSYVSQKNTLCYES